MPGEGIFINFQNYPIKNLRLQKIKDILTEYHIRILDLPLATGLVAEVGQGLSCIAVRADIDALPIQELVEQDFKSEKRCDAWS